MFLSKKLSTRKVNYGVRYHFAVLHSNIRDRFCSTHQPICPGPNSIQRGQCSLKYRVQEKTTFYRERGTIIHTFGVSNKLFDRFQCISHIPKLFKKSHPVYIYVNNLKPCLKSLGMNEKHINYYL